MAWASGRLKTVEMLRVWTIVWIGNFVGAAGTALLVFLSGQYTFGHGAVRHRLPHPQRRIDIPRRDPAPRLKPGIERAQHRRRLIPRGLLADHGQAVAAPQDVNPHLVLDLREVAVEFAAQLDQQPVVGKFEQCFHSVLWTGRGGQRADAQGNLLLSMGPSMADAICRL